MKVKVIITILLIILLLVGGYLILQELQKDQAPDDSSAAADTAILSTQIYSKKITPNVGNLESQYNPWIVKKPNSTNNLMFYCKNTGINGLGRDRIWMAEISSSNTLISDTMVLEGSLGQGDDLSCAPSVATTGPSNLWHMYYLGANRNTAGDIFLYHATSSTSGKTWNKLGKINISVSGYIDSPSISIAGGKFSLYFIGPDFKLYRSSSADGQNFTKPAKMNIQSDHYPLNGNVTQYNGKYYFVYDLSCDTPGLCANGVVFPDAIYLATSQDGVNFSQGVKVLQIKGNTGWDGGVMWTPHLYIPNSSEAYLFHAGSNRGSAYPYKIDNWFSASAVGVTKFTLNLNTNTTCTAFTYSAWSTCTNNKQTRTVATKSPSGCTGGSPVLTRTCTTTSDTNNNTDTDTDTNTGTGVTCGVMDTNGDGKLTIIDFEAFVGMLGAICKDTAQKTGCGGKDANGDNKVDSTDFESFKSRYQISSCQINQ